MRYNLTLIEILNNSAVYVKGLSGRKIGIKEKNILKEHIKLWNLLVHNICISDNAASDNIFNTDDIMNYISANSILSASLKPADKTNITRTLYADDEVYGYICKIVSKISMMFFSTEKNDYKVIFKYIRALHHLPKFYLSAGKGCHDNKETVLSYMFNELK